MPQPTRPIHRLAFCVVGLGLGLSACSTQPTDTLAVDPLDPAGVIAEPADTQPASGSFEASTLYGLLVAEMAAARGLPAVTLGNYLQAAETTRDLGVIKRTAQIAGQLRNRDALLQASLLWIEAEPDNPTPYSFAATELILRGELERAAPMLDKVLQGDDLRAIDALANRAQQMSETERAAYLRQLDSLLAEAPTAPLLYVKAVLVQHQGDPDRALELAQEALELDPSLDRAILLEADLQSQAGHLDTALGHLREELERRDHKQMRTLYTRLLLQKGQYPLAEQQAELLFARYPGDHNLHFYLGALMLEHDRLETSKDYLTRLGNQVGMSSTLHYYLGRIAQQQGAEQEALEHYLAVEESSYLLPGYAEVTKILDDQDDQPQLSRLLSEGRQQHPDAAATLYALEAAWLVDQKYQQQALTLLNQALGEYPDDTRLRYNRAMLGESMGNLDLLEEDLRHVLDLDPDNATALNALGYSLTDHTDRHQEALELIKKALALKPEDPAILDSMGWVYYNLGDYQRSLDYLQQAYQSFPDAEIATHLGKVYWKLGDVNRAMQVWQEALERSPDNPMVLKAIEEAGKHSTARED